MIQRTDFQSCEESDKCASREAWLKLGSNMAVHRSACILDAVANFAYGEGRILVSPIIFRTRHFDVIAEMDT